MSTEISNSINIKEKADFVFLNSGLILSKLKNEATRDDTTNGLQIILFCDNNLDSSVHIKFDLLSKNCDIIYENNYQSAMSIIFYMINFIDASNFNIDGKERLRNKLREYTKYFYCPENELVKNHQFIKFIPKK